MEFKDYYSILGVSRNATEDEIKTAYRNIMKECHPDKNPSKAAEKRAKEASDAYSELSKADKKAKYDRMYDNVMAQKTAKEEKRREEENEKYRNAAEEKARQAHKEQKKAEKEARQARKEQKKAEKEAEKTRRKQEKTERKAERARKRGGNNMNNIEKGTPILGPSSTGKISSKIKVIIRNGVIVVLIGATALSAGMFLGKKSNSNTKEDKDDKETEAVIRGEKDNRNVVVSRIGGKDVIISPRSERPEISVEPSEMPEVPVGPSENNPAKTDSENKPVENTKPTNTESKPAENTKPAEKPEEGKKPVDAVDQTKEKIDTAAASVQASWKNHGVSLDIDTVKELVKCANGMESIYDLDDLDSIINDVASNAVTPTINAAMSGSKHYGSSIKVSDLFIGGQSGLKTLRAMEGYLNGAIKDPDNILIYSERAFTDTALLLVFDETLDGFNASHTTAPAIRIAWARLAGAMTGVAGTLGDDLMVTVNGTTFTQNELNNSSLFKNVVSDAKGSAKQMNY